MGRRIELERCIDRASPSWTVIGTEDRVIPPATQRSMAERAGSTITEVAGSHVSMVSQPQAAIDAILAAVAAIGD
jgi:pimeloyl-ACP methyl ester carboxylesterase